ncbi:MAG: hypothetical protein SFW65_05880 [Alphaproteobacteria bacterium]|nr:hypothetical protein [Alphaproteobacteria bacterium]
MARHPANRDPRSNPHAIIDRRQFERELFDAHGRPTPVMFAFAGRMQKEVGAQGTDAQMAWAETVFNRSAARNHTLNYELRNHGNYNYWPRHQPDPGYSNNPAFIEMITKVMRNGTNLSLGATGNASENVGVGRETFRSRGERFGVETPDSGWWNNRFASLIRGVGRFIGDVASVIGNTIATVATGVVNAGRWVMNRISDMFSPPPPAVHPHAPAPPHHPSYVPQQPPERRIMTPQSVTHTAWVMHRHTTTTLPEPRPEPHRPTRPTV